MVVQRIAVPSGPGRTARDPNLQQGFEEQSRAKEAAKQRRKELWAALKHFVRTNNKGWVVSPPGDMSSMRIECEPHSELPDLLIDRGFELQALGTGTRIEGGKFLPVCIYGLRIPLPR
jgi:hypothetical protein